MIGSTCLGFSTIPSFAILRIANTFCGFMANLDIRTEKGFLHASNGQFDYTTLSQMVYTLDTMKLCNYNKQVPPCHSHHIDRQHHLCILIFDHHYNIVLCTFASTNIGLHIQSSCYCRCTCAPITTSIFVHVP